MDPEYNYKSKFFIRSIIHFLQEINGVRYSVHYHWIFRRNLQVCNTQKAIPNIIYYLRSGLHIYLLVFLLLFASIESQTVPLLDEKTYVISINLAPGHGSRKRKYLFYLLIWQEKDCIRQHNIPGVSIYIPQNTLSKLSRLVLTHQKAI